jgi:predicted P-loop ATPase
MYVPLSFHTSDIENARIMSGALIGELAELSGLKGKDAETTKAWISCTSDSVRKLYQDRVYQLPRRLVLVGTTNRDDFAGDETGHRRLLPVVVGDYQDREAIERDRNQLWAEGLALYRHHGILWKDAQHLARGEHAAFEPTEVGEETIDTWLHTPRGMEFGSSTPLEQEFLTVEEVMKDALHIQPQHFRLETQHRVGRILRKFGLVNKNHKFGKHVRRVWIPPSFV